MDPQIGQWTFPNPKDFDMSWELTLLALVVAPLLIGALQPLLRKLRKGHRRLGNQHGEMTAVVQEAVVLVI